MTTTNNLKEQEAYLFEISMKIVCSFVNFNLCDLIEELVLTPRFPQLFCHF